MSIVAMAGLPGTGKSTLARLIATHLHAPILDKDRLREALFGPHHVEYSEEQDDHCCELLYRTAAFVHARNPAAHVVLDGRTFTRRAQVQRLEEVAAAARTSLRVIECVAEPEIALERLARSADHPAANRGPELYQRLCARSDPLEIERYVVRTDSASAEECAHEIIAWLAGAEPG